MVSIWGWDVCLGVSAQVGVCLRGVCLGVSDRHPLPFGSANVLCGQTKTLPSRNLVCGR